MAFVYPLLSIGGTDYSALVTLEFAEAYLAVDTAAIGWEAGDAETRKKWLVQATRIFDRQNWKGEKTDEANAHEFPRTGIEGIDPDTIPTVMEAATAELASQIANGYDAAGQSTTASGIKSQRAGSVAQEFFAPGTAGQSVGYRFPLPVWELVDDLIEGGGGGELFGGSLASGTCGRSITYNDYSAGPYIGNPGLSRDWE